MCGIAGIIQFKSELNYKKLLKDLNLMSEKISHRGPDDSGTWISKNKTVGFAHRRLSIVDLSNFAHQPMVSGDGRFVITFNGEIYNYKELRQSLSNIGVVFFSDSDTEVLIECYREFGPGCLQKFDGMFSFVLYDLEKDEIFAARDPFGEKPFYYSWVNGAFVFASELSAISVLPQFQTSTSFDSVARFLCFQYVEGDRTFYHDAFKLKPGHYLYLSNKNHIDIQRYFEFNPIESSNIINEDDLVDELDFILTNNIKRRLRADVPVGAFLSGGLDSSLVVAIAKKKLNFDIQTFTIGFKNWNQSEHKDALDIAQYLNTRHTEKLLTPENYNLLDHIVNIIDEPNGDTSLLPTYLVSKLAKESVKVVLSGDGADELFAGYNRYFTTLSESNSQMFTAGNSYYSNKILTFTDTELLAILNNVPNDTKAYLAGLRNSVTESNLNLINRLRKTDIENYLPGAVLAKVDRMSMQHGLEVRTPFLNIEMARFAEKLPPEMLADKKAGKYLLKKLAKRYLSPKVLTKQKKGFGIPSVDWGEKVILDKTSKRLLSKSAINGWWLNSSKINTWLKSNEKTNSFEIYKLWNLYHVDKFIENNNVHPTINANAMQIWLLEEILRNKNSGSILFSILPTNHSSQTIADKIVNVPVWKNKNSKLVYNKKNDWILDFESVFTTAFKKVKLLPKQIVFFDCSANILHEKSFFLIQNGIKYALVFEENMWKTLDIKLNYSLFNLSKHNIYPALFSITDKAYIKHTLKSLFDDFRFYCKSTFLPSSFTLENNPFIYESKLTLLNKDTPLRAYSLIKELLEAIKFYYSNYQFLKTLTSSLKTGFKRNTANKNNFIFILPSLYSGGAERQACNLMIALKMKGYNIKMLSLSPLIGSNGHYLHLLNEANIDVTIIASIHSMPFKTITKSIPKSILNLLSHQSLIMQKQILPVFYHLYDENPGNVICFLDTPNIIGGIAGCLAGVPNVITSFRNINPTSFSFYEDWYYPYYKALITSPSLTLTGNSKAGNKSYASWLKIDNKRVKLLRNGINFKQYSKPIDSKIDVIKSELKILKGDIIIGGIFRISEEKRPELFVETIRILSNKMQNIKAFIIGEGPLKDSVENLIIKYNLSDKIYLLGAVENVSSYIEIAKLILQTSRTEGTANSLLESQYMMKAVVATYGGGVAESLKDNHTGYVVNTKKPEIIAEICAKLLQNSELLNCMGRNGKHFVESEFDLDNSMNQLLKYCKMHD